MFVEAHTYDFYAIMRKRCASLFTRLRASSNRFLRVFVDRWDSPMLRHWVQLHTKRPSWMYKCEPKKGCHRVLRTKTVEQKSGHYKSLSVCRVLCSRLESIWPKPYDSEYGVKTKRIHPDLIRFNLTNVPLSVRPLLTKMIKVTIDNLRAECKWNATKHGARPITIKINIKALNTTLFWNIEESYVLDVKSLFDYRTIDVHVLADTVFGARHALESLVQLVARDMPVYPDKYPCSLHLLVGTKITDSPAYTHRGILLDTARHFIPIAYIKKMIVGMAAAKMNVFHWHVTDSHSFPLESARVPQFTRFGAYSANEIYTAKQVQKLVNFALVHGVRVVIEIDTPSHAANGWQWGKKEGLGDLAVCVNEEPWEDNCNQPPCGQLNPANPNTYWILNKLYQDIAELLPNPILLHVGGDEVFFDCWNKTEEITAYMIRNRMDLSKYGFLKLLAEFYRKALDSWDEVNDVAHQASNLPVMIWSSSLTQANIIQKYLSKDRYAIQVYSTTRSSLLGQLLELGYLTVSTPNDVWYLDRFDADWKKMYSHQLPEDWNMLGGETAMWTEYVDAAGLDLRVWPRAAAVAERLWSNPTTRLATAEPRLQIFRERLINRGLKPDVLSPWWCAQHDTKCMSGSEAVLTQ